MKQVGQIISVLEAAALCFNNARQDIYRGAGYLHEIEENKLWQDKYSSFSEYVETECQLSKGYVSKLMQAYRYYTVGGGVSPERLNGIDVEKAYLALRLPSGTPDEKLVRAEMWSRQQIKDELNSGPDGDCPHNYPQVTICSHCHKRV